MWEHLTSAEQQRVVRLLIERIDYHGGEGKIAITFSAGWGADAGHRGDGGAAVRREDAARDASPAPARVEFEVQFSRGPKGKRRVRAAADPVPAATPVVRPAEDERPRQPRRAQAAATAPVEAAQPATAPEPVTASPATAVPAATPAPITAPPRVPKITLLLVLGHHFERLVREGVVKDYAEIARRTGLTRARVTQIVNLTLLAPGIQEEIFSATCNKDALVERGLRDLVSITEWSRQQEARRCRR